MAAESPPDRGRRRRAFMIEGAIDGAPERATPDAEPTASADAGEMP